MVRYQYIGREKLWFVNLPSDVLISHSDTKLQNNEITHVFDAADATHRNEPLCQHYSSWYTWKKVIAWLLKVLQVLIIQTKATRHLSVRCAEHIIIEHVHTMTVASDVESLAGNKSVPGKCRLSQFNRF